MGLNTYPSNPFPPSTDRMDADALEAEVSKLNNDVKLNTQDLTTPSRTQNILPITLASIKALNTDGTWSGNSYTVNGITFSVSTDSNGNIAKITATGTATNVTYLILVNPFDTVSFAGCLINGLPSEGGSNSFNYRIASSASWSALQDINSNNTAITNNGATCRIAIRIQDTYEIATGGIEFYPMVRLATETSATYTPYIPSVESRIEAVESGLTNLNQLYIGKGPTNLVSAVYAGFITGSGNYVDFYIPCAYDSTISSVSLNSSAKFSIYTFNGTLLTQGYIDFTNVTVVKTEHGIKAEMKFLETQTTYANTIVNIAFGQNSSFTFS